MKLYKLPVAVAGTHGKTTTTSMLTQIALEGNLDPTASIGGIFSAINGNFRIGANDCFILEACEYTNSFLSFFPKIAVILNIDADHLDYFGTLDNVKKSFITFANKGKTVIANFSDPNTRDIISSIKVPVISCGYDKSCDWYADNVVHSSGLHTEFDLYHKGELFTHICLEIPGIHNVLNAAAAAAAAFMSGADAEQISRGLSVFRGAGRRFDKYGEVNGITVCDDYGHHPTELKVTLKAAMEMGFGTVWAVFQPFTFSRTALLLDEFADALSIPDKCIITAIMGSREKNTYNIYDKDLASKIEGAVCFEEQDHDRNFELTAEYAASHAKPGDLILTMGCGDVNKCARLILKKLENRYAEHQS